MDGFTKLLAYGVPAVVCGFMSQMWFRSGVFLASGDVGPWVFTGLEDQITSLWNHVVTGAGSTSSRLTFALPVYFNEGLGALGLSASAGQRIFFYLLYVALGLSVAYLAAAFTRNPVAVAVSGVVAGVNAYVLLSILQTNYIMAIIVTGVLSGMLVRLVNGKRVHPAMFVLATLPASYVANNPPSLILTVVAVCIAPFLGSPMGLRGTAKTLGLYFARTLPFVLLVHLWWLVPYLYANTTSDGYDVVAERSAGQWSWTHAEASIGNVMSLTGHWTWGNLSYHPYLEPILEPWWNWLRFILPAFVIGAPAVVAQRFKRQSLLLLASFVLLVFAAKGLHAPFTAVNRFFYDHVPGVWLFREPVSKIGLLLVVVCAVQVALLVASVAQRLAVSAPGIERKGVAVKAMATIPLILLIAYPYPLLTGSVARTNGVYPDKQVELPREFEDAADAIKTSNTHGKVLELPVLDYYQVRTSWGMYAADTLPQRIIERPVINELAGGYFSASGNYRDLVMQAQQALLQRDDVTAQKALDELGVSHVLIRLDFVKQNGRSFVEPSSVGKAVEDSRLFSQVKKYGDIVEVADVGNRPEIVSVTAGDPPLVSPERNFEWITESPDKYKIRVSPQASPFVVTLKESRSDNWKLSGLPAGVSASRVEAGYANAWSIEPTTQTVELSIVHGPSVWVHRVQYVSIVTLLGIAAWFAWSIRGRLLPRRKPEPVS